MEKTTQTLRQASGAPISVPPSPLGVLEVEVYLEVIDA